MVPRQKWLESVDDYASRLKGIAQNINKRYDVEQLCKDLPKRVKKVIEEEGDRISQYSTHLNNEMQRKSEIILESLPLS